MGPRSPLRFGRRRADIPRMSCAPSSAWLRLLWGRRPWFKVSPPARSARGMRSPRTSLGLRSAPVVAEQTSPGRLAVSAPLRSLQNRRPPGVLRSPLRFGRRRADIPQMSCAPSSARLRLLLGRLSIMIRQER